MGFILKSFAKHLKIKIYQQENGNQILYYFKYLTFKISKTFVLAITKVHCLSQKNIMLDATNIIEEKTFKSSINKTNS